MGNECVYSGTFSIPITVTSLSFERAMAISIPMNPVPTTTTFFLPPVVASTISFAWGTVRRGKMPLRSLNPGRGRFFGDPPVARTSLS